MPVLTARRQFLIRSAATALAGTFSGCASQRSLTRRSPQTEFAPLRMAPDQITAISVCTRPFRAQGPRLETERRGDKTVIHHYGHGGSGWSLSWGWGNEAAQLALASSERDIAVMGCGAIGLTTAVLLARAGARVTIYAKELPPFTRSSSATGVFSPDSRIALAQTATDAFKKSWNERARYSYRMYQSLLGLADQPVEYVDAYAVDGGQAALPADPANASRPRFAALEETLLADLEPKARTLPTGTHTLGHHELIGSPMLMFNISAYTRLLVSDFRSAGGTIQMTEFASAADFARLSQKVLVNATGYGARALLNDESIVPVRGQIARTPAQANIRYALQYRDSFFVPRRDGFVFQVLGSDDYYGYGNDSTAPDRAEAEHAVQTIQSLFPPA